MAQIDPTNLLANSAMLVSLLNTSTVNGLTKAQIAKTLGVSQDTVVDLVNGQVSELTHTDQFRLIRLLMGN